MARNAAWRSKIAAIGVAAAALCLSSCSTQDEDKGPEPFDGSVPDSAYEAFGKACTIDADCNGGICFKYGDGTQACTVPCGSSDQCPAGSQGQKCNNYGRCRT